MAAMGSREKDLVARDVGGRRAYPDGGKRDARTTAKDGDLHLNDGFDQVPVDGDELSPVFVVDQDIGQADKQSLFFVDRVRDTIAHRGDQKIADIGAIHRSDTDAYLFALRHLDLQSPVRTLNSFDARISAVCGVSCICVSASSSGVS